MKKYDLILFLTAVILAVFLSACENNNGTRIVIYTEPYPQLTSMTQITTTPADTYSEYMATYTPTETTSYNYFAAPSMYGVAADTFGTSPETAVTIAPITDTAVTIPPVTEAMPETETVPSTESVSETEEPSETEAASGSEISESSGTTRYWDTPAAFPELPAADTANPHTIQTVQTDTAPTMYSETDTVSETDTNTSNGGKLEN